MQNLLRINLNNFLLFLILFIFNFSYLYSSNLQIEGLSKLSKQDLNAITTIDLNKNNITLDEVNIIIKELYSSDLIFDVFLEQLDNTFKIQISESSIIQNIYINGNIFIKDEVITSNISSQENYLFNKDTIAQDILDIKKIYLSQGFRDVEISFFTEKFSEDKINLIVSINEGDQSKLNEILISGNSYASDRFIYSLMSTKIYRPYNIFTSGSNFDLSQLGFDLNKISSFYKDNGFFDIEISYELIKKSKFNFLLHVFINENEQTKIINLKYDIDDNPQFRKIINTFEKELSKNKFFFSRDLINSFIEDLNNSLISYNNLNSFIDFKLSNSIDGIDLIVFNSKKNLELINKINIYGNTITKEKVIRSKIKLQPGDYYRKDLISKTKKQILKTKYVNKVEINKNINNEKLDLDVEITENKKTGNFLFGGSFSGDTGFGLAFSIKDYNFLGTGNEVNSEIDINSEKTSFKVAYTSYPLLNPNIQNKYTLFNLDRDLTDSFGYKTKERGISYGIGFDYKEKISVSSGLEFSEIKGYHAKNNEKHIQDSIGNFNQITLEFSLLSNSTNDFFYPTNGFKNRLSITLSPENISDDSYIKLRGTNENYFKLSKSKNFIFLHNNIGIAESLEDNLKTVNAFSLGGLNFKGFDYRGIGPFKDNLYLGGNKFFTTTLGYGSSFIFDEKDNINIKLFTTVGSIWDSDYSSDNDFNLRSSTGVSFDILTPIGPLSLSYATVIEKLDKDKTREFNFSIGTSF